MREPFFERLKDDFVRRTIFEIVKWTVIAFGLALWSAVVAGSVASTHVSLTPYRTPLIVTAVLLAFFLVGGLYRRATRFRPRFPRLAFDFLLLRKELYYKRDTAGHIEYRKHIQLKALKGGLDTYRDKYHWTGSGTVTLTSGIKGQAVYETVRKNVWQCYEIRFQRTLAKGDTIDTEVVCNIDDSDCKAVPFFSATVEEPTEYLKLDLTLPANLGITEVTREVSTGIGASKPITSELVALNTHGEVSFSVSRPSLLYHYEIKWLY
jgi:hypothetical protein